MTEQELQALADRLDADLMTCEEYDALPHDVRIRMMAKRVRKPTDEEMPWFLDEAKRLGLM